MPQEYRYFTSNELKCKCDACRDDDVIHMDERFMQLIVALREDLGFGFPVTSAYRCEKHPAEARKEEPGAHFSGMAMDIKVSGVRAYKLLRGAMDMDFVGIGVSQKGDHEKRFIHLDMDYSLPRPRVWSY